MSGRLDESELLRAPGVAQAMLGPGPAWVWDVVGGRILLASAAGISFFGAKDAEALCARRFDMSQPRMAPLARLGRSLPQDGSNRLSLLRFFVGLRDVSLPCQCSLLTDVGRDVVLVVAGGGAPSKAGIGDRFLVSFDALGTPLVLTGASGEVCRNVAAHDVAGDPTEGGTIAIALPEGRFVLHLVAVGAEAEIPADAAERPSAPVDMPQPEEGPGPVSGPEAEEGSEPAPETAAPGAFPGRVLPERRRFTFQLDPEGRFVEIGAGLAALLGPRAAEVVGRTIEETGVDVEGRLRRALETHDTWSDIEIDWPTDFGKTARLRLSALPRFGEGRAFAGFRGFADVLSLTAPESEVAAPVAEAEPVADAEPEAAKPVQTEPEELEPPAQPESEPEPEAEEIEPEEAVAARAGEGSRVFRLHAFKRASAEGGSLNDHERNAFKAIAEALGAHWAGQGDEEPAAGPEAQIEAPQVVAEPAEAEIVGEAGIKPAAEAVPDEPEEEPAPVAPSPPAPVPEPAPHPAPDLILDVFDRVPLGLAILRDRKVLAANRAFLDLFGYSDIDDLEVAGGVGALLEGRNGDENVGTAVSARRRDGGTFRVEARLGRTPWIDGPAMMMSVRAAEPEGRLPADELRAVLDAAFDGVFVLDAGGEILQANARGAMLAGADADELEGRPFTDLVAGDDRATVADLVQSLIEGGVPSVLEKGREVTLLADGREVPVQVSLGRLGTGEPARICVVLRDLTDWKEAEADLVAARRRAEAASAQKSDFLAKMSHEIRTPLNGIIGFSEVILEERFGALGNDRYKEYVKDIRESGEHLMSLVNDLLDLSKVEAGKLEMSFTSVRLNDVVEQSVAVMQPQSSRARVVIRSSLGRGLPAVVADTRSIRQVLLNILSNAIKFTPPGGQVIVSTAQGESGEVHLRIRDTGVGMSESDVAVAMEPFRQLPVTPTTGERGTGLGLPLAKALAEANRATFALHSKPGEGTMVEITFPQQRVLAE